MAGFHEIYPPKLCMHLSFTPILQYDEPIITLDLNFLQKTRGT